VKIVGTCRVVDALGEWGRHNTSWRARREITDASEGVDFVLTYYSDGLDLVRRILGASPFGCIRAELVADDLPKLILCDRTTVSAAWAKGLHEDGGQTGERVRAMVAAKEAVAGPLICTCQTVIRDLTVELKPPLVIFDGWTRTAAWILHGQGGRVYPMAANLILVKTQVSLQSGKERNS
jgi:hypothetical protein